MKDVTRAIVALATLVLASGCETLQSGTPGMQASFPEGWRGSTPTVEVVCAPGTGEHIYWINLASNWEPSGPGKVSVDGSEAVDVRWHRTMAIGGYIGFAMVLADSEGEMRDIVAIFQNRDDYTPPPAELRAPVETGDRLNVAFHGYNGTVAWGFDLAAVRAEASEKCT